MLAARAFAIWLLILVFAVANGAFREAVLLPNLSRPVAFVLSGVLLSLCVLAVSIVLIPRLGPLPSSTYWAIGFSWLALTLAFEFGFGRLLRGKSWRELVDAYTFKDGDIWPLVLLVVLVAPWVARHLSSPR